MRKFEAKQTLKEKQDQVQKILTLRAETILCRVLACISTCYSVGI